MRLTQSGTRLVIADTPGALWLLGLAFVVSGTLVLTLPLFAFNWAAFGIWERLAVVAIGASHLGGGLWTIRSHEQTRTELDRAAGTGTQLVRRPGERARRVTRFRIADVREVELIEERDSDGDRLYRIALGLLGGSTLPLMRYSLLGEESVRLQAEEIRRFLDLPAR
jgi:hypothetical protein